MSPIVTILVYCVLVTVASLAGGWLPTLIRLTHLRRQLMMSVVSGVMLGVALLHMLPQAIDYLPSSQWVGGSLMAGVLVMFFLIRVFHAHSHDDPAAHAHEHEHDRHEHDQHEHKQHAHDHEHGQARRFGWAGLFVGLTLHSILDGVALAASVMADASHNQGELSLLGLGTFLAVFLHKPLDALAITSVMRATRWSLRARGIVNALFALTCPLGILLFSVGATRMGVEQEMVVGAALAFSAGFFLCIALADLLPEVAFHSHDRGKLSAALIIGVVLAIVIEMTHSHVHEHEPGPTTPVEQEHRGHNHS